ncbi:hypothetical protein PM082_020817 [Marasmius tenuissimus]|nr:hypothetical protein PM082_020817 [Marasmius tenuissimus]
MSQNSQEQNNEPKVIIARQPNGENYRVSQAEGEVFNVRAPSNSPLQTYNPYSQRVYNNPQQPLYAQAAEATLPTGQGALNSVPMLAQDRSNWKEFIRALEAYYCTQGNAKVITESKPDTPATDATEAVKNEYKTWQDRNEKCFGALQMRTYPIHDAILDPDSVIDCISNIKANYGSENTAELLNMHTNLHSVGFPSNQSPVAGINYMATQRHKLKAQDIEIPEALFVLMIIAKLLK